MNYALFRLLPYVLPLLPFCQKRSINHQYPKKKKADVVRARNKDGGKQTTGSGAIRTSGGNKKQRKTTKEVDRECERRPNGTRNEHERSGGQQQEQKDLEKSC